MKLIVNGVSGNSRGFVSYSAKKIKKLGLIVLSHMIEHASRTCLTYTSTLLQLVIAFFKISHHECPCRETLFFKSCMVGDLNAALNQNASSLVPQLFLYECCLWWYEGFFKDGWVKRYNGIIFSILVKGAFTLNVMCLYK